MPENLSKTSWLMLCILSSRAETHRKMCYGLKAFGFPGFRMRALEEYAKYATGTDI